MPLHEKQKRYTANHHGWLAGTSMWVCRRDDLFAFLLQKKWDHVVQTALPHACLTWHDVEGSSRRALPASGDCCEDGIG